MNRDRLRLAALALAFSTALAPSTAIGGKLYPDEPRATVAVEVAGRSYRYFPVTAAEPLHAWIDGPAVLGAIARWRFQADPAPIDLEIAVVVDGVDRWRYVFRTKPGRARYPELPGATPGKAEVIELDIPSGRHEVEVRLVAPTAGTVDVNLTSRPPSVLPWRLEWRGAVGAAYHSNIFRYSDSDVEDFLDGLRGDRFPIDGVDDLVLEPAARLSLIREEPDRRVTELRAGGAFHLASVNGQKSFSVLRLAFREERPRAAYLEAEYRGIPKYHLRELWDVDAGEYRACDFQKHGFRIEMGSDRSLPVDVAAFCSYEIYWYNPGFVEYDAVARSLGFVATVRPRKDLRLDAGYTLRSSAARGYDEVGETRCTSDDSDATYDQDAYELRLRWGGGEWWGHRAVVSLRTEYRRRFYLTEKGPAADPYHAGRRDEGLFLAARVGISAGESAHVVGFVEYRRRTVESDVLADIGAVKDYTALKAGVRLIVEGVRFLD